MYIVCIYFAELIFLHEYYKISTSLRYCFQNVFCGMHLADFYVGLWRIFSDLDELSDNINDLFYDTGSELAKLAGLQSLSNDGGVQRGGGKSH